MHVFDEGILRAVGELYDLLGSKRHHHHHNEGKVLVVDDCLRSLNQQACHRNYGRLRYHLHGVLEHADVVRVVGNRPLREVHQTHFVHLNLEDVHDEAQHERKAERNAEVCEHGQLSDHLHVVEHSSIDVWVVALLLFDRLKFNLLVGRSLVIGRQLALWALKCELLRPLLEHGLDQADQPEGEGNLKHRADLHLQLGVAVALFVLVVALVRAAPVLLADERDDHGRR